MNKTDKRHDWQGTIESIAFGGDGVLRHQGQAVFVPFTVHQDEVVFEPVVYKKSFMKARLLEIVRPSPMRVVPQCRHFYTCGGCQLQHLGYADQLLVKQQFVKDALLRIGKFSNVTIRPIVGADVQWNYRRHIRLHFSEDAQGHTMGFVAHEGEGLIEVEECPIFNESLSDVLRAIKSLIVLIKNSSKCAVKEVKLFKSTSGKYVVLFEELENALHISTLFAHTLQTTPILQGIMWGGKYGWHRVGECHLQFELEGMGFIYNPRVFVQAHPEQSGKLYLKLAQRLKRLNPKRVLDLYCGIGVTSLLTARKGVEVLAIEKNKEAIRLARENAKRNNTARITFTEGDADEHIEHMLLHFKPCAVIVNPPRTGLSKSVKEALFHFVPKDIFYISCMPATLARDLFELSKVGYQIVYCRPYDLFPQTTHVETIVQLTNGVV